VACTAGAVHSSPAGIAADLRSATAAALRWIPTGRADTLLSHALISDPDAAVRQAAAFALGFRKTGAATFHTLKSAVLNDKSVQVRLMLLEDLWKAHRAFPEVRALLHSAAIRDASADVRKAATGLLARDREAM